MTTNPDEQQSATPPWKMIASAIAVSVVLGVVGGFVWALLAPPEQFVVVSAGRGAALTGESLHRFDSIALFVCIAFSVGVVVPVMFWMHRSIRGPLLCLGLLVGAAAGSAATLGIGIWVAQLVHPRPDDPAVGAVVAVAPGFETPLVLLVQALTTSLVLLLLAAMNPHDDLRSTPHDDESDETDAAGWPLESDRAS